MLGQQRLAPGVTTGRVVLVHGVKRHSVGCGAWPCTQTLLLSIARPSKRDGGFRGERAEWPAALPVSRAAGFAGAGREGSAEEVVRLVRDTDPIEHTEHHSPVRQRRPWQRTEIVHCLTLKLFEC